MRSCKEIINETASIFLEDELLMLFQSKEFEKKNYGVNMTYWRKLMGLSLLILPSFVPQWPQLLEPFPCFGNNLPIAHCNQLDRWMG